MVHPLFDPEAAIIMMNKTKLIDQRKVEIILNFLALLENICAFAISFRLLTFSHRLEQIKAGIDPIKLFFF